MAKLKKLDEEVNFYVKPYNFNKVSRPLQFWKHYRKFNSRFFMIMHKSNGMIDLMYVYHEKNMFVYNQGIYIINKDYAKWSDELNCFVGYYIEGIAVPINLEVDEKLLKESIKENMQGTRVEANVDSHILYSTVNTEVIQKLMRGEELEAFMQNLKMLFIVSLGLGVMTFGLLVWKLLGK